MNKIAVNQDNSEKNIRFDWAMKHLLRNKENYVAVEGFLNAFLKEYVTVTSIADDNEYPEHFNRVDIKGELANGEKILVELQNSNTEDFESHFFHVLHANIREKHAGMNRVFQLYIVHSEAPVDSEDYIYQSGIVFRNMEDDKEVILPDSSMKYFELSAIWRLTPKTYIVKLNNFNNEIREPLDEWVYYLKNNVIPDNFTAEGLPEAREILKTSSLPEEEYNSYIQYIEANKYV
ncbi:MAG: Rpn family recombination-promoting nuclease/putative transposase [Prevotellaceae bacterium]|jgi:hypothetical protein|nr:Rpn family recombination-promoting nuclease/putative transposase [Prevotellaceae bacterium]